MQLTVNIDTWQPAISASEAHALIHALESGQVVYFPALDFVLEDDERRLLDMTLNPLHAKNISYNPKDQSLRGLDQADISVCVKKMMARYHQMTTQFLNQLCPSYQAPVYAGRTSFRPVEIKDRRAPSYRKDDTRLHVDAFPSTPQGDKRILRIFTNINPMGDSRHWHLGEPFQPVAQRFLPQARRPWPLELKLLHYFKITRKKRTRYDHYMLQIHDRMKKDLAYQQQVRFTSVQFPPGSSWMVYTDVVSHAALAGRFVLEQTFNPPINHMQNPALSPQQQMQRLLPDHLF